MFLIMGMVGCAGKGQGPGIAQQTSVLESLPFVYKMTVQQGNVLSAERVANLKLGMSKRQVRFLLGTPLLIDFFHVDRWDYSYTIRRGHQAMEIKRLALYFKDDALVRIEGDYQSGDELLADRETEPLVVSVPDWEDRRGLLTRILDRGKADPDTGP